MPFSSKPLARLGRAHCHESDEAVPACLLTLLIVLMLVLAGCTEAILPETTVPPEAGERSLTTIQPSPSWTPDTEPTQSPASPIARSEASNTAAELGAHLDATLSEMAQQGEFSGAVLVARNGHILLSAGYGLADRDRNIPNTEGTRFRIGSLTKQFTATAVLILQEQGRLQVRDPICNYLSDCPVAWQAITIEQLLSHTSGIPDLIRFPNFPAIRATPSPPRQTISLFRDQPLDFQPGTAWRYSNSGYIVLGQVIEEASGVPYESFLHQHIFKPLGLSNTGYDWGDSDLAAGYANRSRPADFIDMSIPYAAGALFSSVEDLYRWDQALYTDRLIAQGRLEEMFARHAAIPGGDGAGYGYGWVIADRFARLVYEHSGVIEGFSAHIARFPGDRVTIIVLTNRQDLDPVHIRNLIAEKVFAAW